MKKVLQQNLLTLLAFVCFGFISSQYLPNYWQRVMTFTLLYAYIVSCWNIMAGFAGLISLGHMTFVGIGAYTSSLLYIHAAISPWLGMIVGAFFAGVVAYLIGFLSYRMRLGHLSVSLMTLVVNQVFVILATNITITGGAMGLRIPPNIEILNAMFSADDGFFYLATIMVCAILCYCNFLRYSRLGHRLLALRGNERAAEALGVPIVSHKIIATCLSAVLAAFGGTFLAQYVSFIDPLSVFSVTGSLEIIIFGFVGGMGSAFGPILGTLLLYPLGELLRASFSNYGVGLNRIIFGIALVFVSILAPRGILGTITDKISLRKTSVENSESLRDENG